MTITTPFPQSFWVIPDVLLAGQYPFDPTETWMQKKLTALMELGVTRFINLTDPREMSVDFKLLTDYRSALDVWFRENETKGKAFRLFDWVDASAPTMEQIDVVFKWIDEAIEARQKIYLHCYGGHGRTGTVIAALLIRNGWTVRNACGFVRMLRKDCPKNHDPFEVCQIEFLRQFHEHCGRDRRYIHEASLIPAPHNPSLAMTDEEIKQWSDKFKHLMDTVKPLSL